MDPERAKKIVSALRLARRGLDLYAEKKAIDRHMTRLTAGVHRGLNGTDAASRVLNEEVLPSDVRYAAGTAFDWAAPRTVRLIQERMKAKRVKK